MAQSVDGGLIDTGNEAEGETVTDENGQGQKMNPADGTVERSERLKGARAKGEEMADTAVRASHRSVVGHVVLTRNG